MTCGFPLVDLSEKKVLENLYRLAIDIGTCPERDYYMYGNHFQNQNLMTKNRASRKTRNGGYANAITRALRDHLFLLQLVDNRNLPPWFVACCQIIWRTKSPEERDQAIEDMCTHKENDPTWYVPDLIYDIPSRLYGEPTFDPFALRGSVEREERDADVAGARAKEGAAAGKPAPSQPGKGKGGKGGKGKGAPPPARSRSPRSPTFPPGDLGFKGGNKGRGGDPGAKGKGKGKNKGEVKFDEFAFQGAHDFW